MAETFEAYRTRVLSYLGDEAIGVRQAASQLESRLRDVAPEGLIKRPTPEKWSIAEIVAPWRTRSWPWGGDCRNMLRSGTNVVAGSGRGLESAWVTRSKMRAFRQECFRALRGESNLRCWSRSRARWVEMYGVHEVRGRQTVEVRPLGSGTRLEPSLKQIDRILGGCM